jgi:fatty acid desaturase
MSKYLINKILFLSAFTIFINSWVFIYSEKFQGLSVIFWMLNLVTMHYMFTTVHQASHGLLSKNKIVNYFFGFMATLFTGITFADFKFTHDLHHLHIGTPELDPDHKISGSGSVVLIPFKIFYHDYYFLKNNKNILQTLSYFIQRTIQISIIMVLFVDKTILFTSFWLAQMLVIGMLNALFLFYFPHYTHWIESTRLNIKPLRESIKMSRDYHHMHHDNPSGNGSFFPFETTISAFLRSDTSSNYNSKKNYFYTK